MKRYQLQGTIISQRICIPLNNITYNFFFDEKQYIFFGV